jgi:hypothetical protein
MLKRFSLVLVFGFSACSAQAGIDMSGCQPVIRGADYPFDYHDKIKSQLFLGTVERRHFTRDVETLLRGSTATHPYPDIAYTLEHIPNHPRALQSLLRLAAREKVTHFQGASISVECFVKRAIEFAPNDLVPQMILAQYYAAQGKPEAALTLLLEAEKKAPNDSNLAYNLGLLQVELKSYDSALTYAHRAYLGGFPLPGLREKLKRAGVWREPATTAADAKPASGGAPPAAEVKPAMQPPPSDAPQPSAPAAVTAVPGAQDAITPTVPVARPAEALASPFRDAAPAKQP